MRAILLLATTALLLAGCGSKAPSGEFSADRHNVVTDGSIDLMFQAAQQPYPSPLLCPPSEPPIPESQWCKPAKTTASAHFMSLREPSPEGYKLYWADSSGQEVEIGALTANGTMYELPETTFDDNYASFTEIQLRMGTVKVGSAANQDGAAFTPNAMLTSINVTGTYKGRDLTVTVDGAMDGASYTGFLYEELEDGTAAQASGQSFVIGGDGTYEFRADRNIADFVEFHIHVAGSKLNVAQADI